MPADSEVRYIDMMVSWKIQIYTRFLFFSFNAVNLNLYILLFINLHYSDMQQSGQMSFLNAKQKMYKLCLSQLGEDNYIDFAHYICPPSFPFKFLERVCHKD